MSHSLIHSLNHVAEHCEECLAEAANFPITLYEGTPGLDGPDPVDVLSRLDQAVLEAQRIRSFSRDYRAKVKKTARTYVDVQEEILQIQYSQSRTCYWFVTINPKSTVPISELHNMIVKMLDRPEVVDCLWTYEIREAPDKGLHAHVCFQTDKIMDSNFVNRKIKNLFHPKLCGHKKHIDVKWPDSAEEYQKCKDYATKKMVSKKKKQSNTATIDWRKKNHINDIYGMTTLLVWSSLPQILPDQEENHLIPLN